MYYDHTLLAFKQDIANRGLVDWLEAHTSFMRPLHRYSGLLQINKGFFFYSGTDTKNGDSFELNIKLSEITGIHLGYDNVFK